MCTYIIGQAAYGKPRSPSALGQRKPRGNSCNLMHQPPLPGVMEGQVTDIEIEAREMLRLRDRHLPDLQRRHWPDHRPRHPRLRPQQVASTTRMVDTARWTAS